MELFRISLPKLNNEQTSLYINGEGCFSFIEEHIAINKHSTVSFDTFFNLFSHTKYKKYTRANNITLSLRVCGRLIAGLYSISQSGERSLIKQVNSSGDTSLEQRLDINFSLEDIQSDGFIYFTLTAQNDDCFFYGGEYLCSEQPQDVKIGVVICTYMREQYVKNNINRLLSYFELNPSLSERLNVFIIDNGKTLNQDDFPSFVRVYKNKNLGGAGGFTRGIIEVYNKKDSEGFTHFLLMDDDIQFLPEILNKTASLLAMLRAEFATASVGAGMLMQDEPCRQYEFGAKWKGRFLESNMRDSMVNKTSDLLKNEIDCKADYNAWWYYCMPVSVVDRVNLPLPLFIKTDDVEYSLRGATNIILMNGIAVWHEEFDKKPSDWLEYYVKRNELVVCAMHSNGRTRFKNFFKAVRAVGKALCYHRYDRINLIFKAYDDFLKGASFLANVDGESLHKSLLAHSPRLLNATQLKEEYNFEFGSIDIDKMRNTKKKRRLFLRAITLNGYLIPRIFMPKKYKGSRYKVVDMKSPKAVEFYNVVNTLQLYPEIKSGLYTSIKKKFLLKSLFGLVRLYFKMLFCYNKAVKSYQNDKNLYSLTSLPCWLSRLEE